MKKIVMIAILLFCSLVCADDVRLPRPRDPRDARKWGAMINRFLRVSHNDNGTNRIDVFLAAETDPCFVASDVYDVNTESELESWLFDITDVFTNNDGSLEVINWIDNVVLGAEGSLGMGGRDITNLDLLSGTSGFIDLNYQVGLIYSSVDLEVDGDVFTTTGSGDLGRTTGGYRWDNLYMTGSIVGPVGGTFTGTVQAEHLYSTDDAQIDDKLTVTGEVEAGNIDAPTGRCATLTVAASDSSTTVQEQADSVCSGTADDVQIQAALTTATTGGGGIVHLSEGTFAISAMLTINDGVVLEGEGNKTILALDNAVNTSLIQNTTRTGGGDSDITIRNIRFDGNKSNNSTTPSAGGVIDMKLVHGLILDNVEVVEADMVGVAINTCNSIRVTNSYFATCDKDALALNLSSYDATIIGNEFYSCGHVDSATNAAIEIQDGTYDITISSNVINACAYGIEISSHLTASGGLPPYNITVSTNTIKDCIRGILTIDSEGGDNAPKNVTISDNTLLDTVEAAGRYQFYFRCLKNSVISDNTISNYQQRAVYFAEVLDDIIFTDNILKCLEASSNNVRYGVEFENDVVINRFNFSNNIIDNYGYKEVFFDGGTVTDFHFHDNMITNADQANAGRPVRMDALTSSRCVMSNNYLDGAHHIILTDAGDEELPVGWSCREQENYNKRTLTNGTYNIEVDENNKLFVADCTDGDVIVNLPAATIGLEFSFVVSDATNELRLNPDGAEFVKLADGTKPDTGGDYITNDGAKAVGDGCRLRCRVAGVLEHFDSVGTWTEE